jgi:2-phosphosulfolactate phosphatase
MHQSSRPEVQVCLSPALIGTYDVQRSVVVVIDILRATTCICAALDNGVQYLVPVQTVEECEAFRPKGYICAAERDGQMVPGMDLGNSPESYLSPDLKGKKIAFTTTNGTQAIHAARGALEIVVGSFSNMTALVKWLRERGDNVLLLCSGWKNRVNLEDTSFAGAIVAELETSHDIRDDASIIARTLFQMVDKNKRAYMQYSAHYERITDLNLQQDVKYSLRRDRHPVVPIYKDGRLVKL